jgi:site-specific DNA-methyltransferase (cytosine-N4-specific)
MGYNLLCGDALETLKTLPTESVQCVVTSPPYYDTRDYQVEGQYGLEPHPRMYLAKMVEVFAQVRRVLKSDGTCWVNIADTYSSGKRGRADSGPDGHFGGPRLDPVPRKTVDGWKPRELMMIPARLAMGLQEDGWYLRSDIIWHKTNGMPEGAQYSRPIRSHEHVFLLSKSQDYFYFPVKEPCETQSGYRPIRDVWPIPTGSFKGAHFAVFPFALPERCILAGSRPGDVVLDPFMGSGTTGAAALRHMRGFIGIDLKPEYVAMAEKRLAGCYAGLDV